MPLYIGYPITLKEAFRILRLEGYDEHKHKSDNYSIISDYLEKIGPLNIYWIDKGQCVLGYHIKSVTDVWEKFTEVDEFIVNVIELKNQLRKDLIKINADIDEITFEYMEGEPKTFKNPLPVILEW
jgi:hypothetical protein